MNTRARCPLLIVSLLALVLPPALAEEKQPRILTPTGTAVDGSFFPIAVWLQSPRQAARFQEAGINLYVGLWEGPTEAQLAELGKAGMPVICDQNAVGLAHRDDPLIAGWMHGDEPDNAQARPDGKGYGPPILPEVIVAGYERLRKADPSRPVLLNLGQGVAFDNYIGRGVRRNRLEDYPQYVKGCDIASFDIYPVVHESPEVTGKLEFVARGVERLVKWSEGGKAVWNCIECTDIHGIGRKASPAQVRSEVWMALVSGSRGLVYFVHQFKPDFKEAALLSDPETLAGVTAINRQIRELAPVLNSPNVAGRVAVGKPTGGISVATMVKEHGGSTYVFAVNLSPEPGTVRFSLPEAFATRAVPLDGTAGVVLKEGQFASDFPAYGVNLYRLDPARP